MFTKIALSIAIMLGTASGVLAATKHAARHAPMMAAGTYGAYWSAKPMPGRVGETGAILIQDRLNSFSTAGGGVPYCGGRC